MEPIAQCLLLAVVLRYVMMKGAVRSVVKKLLGLTQKQITREQKFGGNTLLHIGIGQNWRNISREAERGIWKLL